jgi:hypothetical protein
MTDTPHWRSWPWTDWIEDGRVTGVPPEIRKFLDGIQGGELKDLDKVTHDRWIQDLFQQLLGYIHGEIIAHMPRKYRNAFCDIYNELLKRERSRESVQRFVQEHIPDVEIVFSEAFSRYRKSWIKTIEAVDLRDSMDW